MLSRRAGAAMEIGAYMLPVPVRQGEGEKSCDNFGRKVTNFGCMGRKLDVLVEPI